MDTEHNRRLQTYLIRLKEALELCGVEVFLDIARMDGNMKGAMRRNIDRSDVVIFVCTPRFKERAMEEGHNALKFEIETALGKGEALKVAPILVTGNFGLSVPNKPPVELPEFLIRTMVDTDRFADQLVQTVNPLGLIPSVLGMSETGIPEAYQRALEQYRRKAAEFRPSLPDGYVERPALIEEIRGRLRKGGYQGMVVLAGPGGTGKTSLASGVANDPELSFGFVRRLDCEKGLDGAFAVFAETLRIDPKGLKADEIRREVYSKLEGETWMLIFDNVEDASAMSAALPRWSKESKWRAVVTTRAESGWHPMAKISVGGMTMTEAVTVLCGLVGGEEPRDVEDTKTYFGGDKDLGALAEKLHLNARELRVAFGAMSEISGVDNRAEEYLRQVARFEDARTSDGTSIIAGSTLKALADLGDEAPARALMQWLSLLDPDNIPLWVFARAELLGGEEKVREAVEDLIRAGLVTRSSRQGYVSVHRVVQEAARGVLGVDQDDASWWRVAEPLMGALADVCPGGSRGALKTEERMIARELMPHMARLAMVDAAQRDTVHLANARLLGALGNALGEFGDYLKKREILERALVINELQYGRDHAEVAITLANLGIAYGSLGGYGKQKELLERALEIFERSGSDPEKVATTLSNLGNAHGSLGNYKKKRELLERALGILEGVYGGSHVRVAATLANLGNALGALGSYDKQRELLERALEINLREYGPSHVQVALTLTSLGSAYGSLGDHARQKELLERALTIQEREYGPHHVQVAITLTNLGNAHGCLGGYHEQKRMHERALEIMESHFGPEHVKVAATLVCLSTAYDSLGDHAKQKELLERALAIQEREYGLQHVQVAITLGNLGNAYGSLGDYGKKKELLERALVIDEREYGPDHSPVARMRAYLGYDSGSGEGAPEIKKRDDAPDSTEDASHTNTGSEHSVNQVFMAQFKAKAIMSTTTTTTTTTTRGGASNHLHMGL